MSADSPTAVPAEAPVLSPLDEEIAAAKARGEKAAAAAAEKPAPPAKSDEPRPPKAPVPTAAEIEADIAAARERLTETLVRLEDSVSPENIAKRGKAAIKGVYVDEFGGLKLKNIGITAGVVVGVVVVIKILK